MHILILPLILGFVKSKALGKVYCISDKLRATNQRSCVCCLETRKSAGFLDILDHNGTSLPKL